jgi:hypothetical protein
MCRMLGKQRGSALDADTVGNLKVMPLLSSTCFDVNVSLNETFFALVLAR